MDLTKKNILVTGGGGFLGSHVVEALERHGVPKERIRIPRSAESDLRTLEACRSAVTGQEVVIHLAALAGGIGFNKENPGKLFYDNLLMGVFMMEAAREAGVEKYISIGTICSYPKDTPVPFREEDLWNGYPEDTNAPYGLAKKMQLVQAQAYRAQYDLHAIHLLPVNLYGPRDTFDELRSHVIPAMIVKFVRATARNERFVDLWGTGAATREFLYAPDAAEGIVLATERYDKAEPVNIGAGFEIAIRELAHTIAELTGYTGELRWDHTKPDGQPRRSLDTKRAQQEFGFEAKTPFLDGLKETIAWYKANTE